MLFLKTKTQLAEKRELGGSRFSCLCGVFHDTAGARNQSSNRRGWKLSSVWQTIPSAPPNVNRRDLSKAWPAAGRGLVKIMQHMK